MGLCIGRPLRFSFRLLPFVVFGPRRAPERNVI